MTGLFNMCYCPSASRGCGSNLSNLPSTLPNVARYQLRYTRILNFPVLHLRIFPCPEEILRLRIGEALSVKGKRPHPHFLKIIIPWNFKKRKRILREGGNDPNEVQSLSFYPVLILWIGGAT